MRTFFLKLCCLSTVIFLLSTANVHAQSGADWCPSDELRRKAIATDPNYRLKQAEFEQNYQRNVTNYANSPLGLRSGVIQTLPIVVHIFHSGEAVGTTNNPSDDFARAWILKASNQFRHTSGATFPNNPFSGIDTEIELCLSRRDPSGNPSTGINRYNVPSLAVLPSGFNHAGFSTYLWDPTKYCNLVIITSSPPDYSYCGLYAGNPDATFYTVDCIGSLNFPNAGLMNHELGHYLGLGHTFDGGCTNTNCLTNGDRVCDTPPKASAGFGSQNTCANPSNSCTTDADDVSTNNPFRPVANGGLGDRPDVLENYMDYTASCWAAFTQGQKARMKTNLASRTALTNNTLVCTPIANACVAPVTLSASINNTNAQLSWTENASATSWEIKYGPSGFNPSTSGTAVTVTTNAHLLPNLALNTTYDWYVRGICPTQASGFSAFSAVGNFTTPATATYCGITYTQPCFSFSHSSGTIPTTISGFSVRRTSDNVSVINNQSNGCLGSVSDHTAITGNVAVGSGYTFTLTNGSSAGGFYYSSYVGVWIDYNNDKDFEDANESVYQSATPVTGGASGNFTIPSGIPNGQKRVRVRRVSSAFAGVASCMATSNGETEDYTLNVTGGIVIPLELLAFQAKSQLNQTIALDWSTASEQNVAHFDVERSFDSKVFEKIGTVKAVSNGAQQTYQFVDNQPKESVIYYRLKMVDADGQSKYSPIRSVIFNAKTTVLVYPNPTPRGKGLTFETKTTDVFDVKIVDLQGRVVLKTTFSESTVLNVNQLPQGLYLYELTSKNHTQFGKIVLE